MKNKPNEFDEYLQQSEPGRRDKAQTWRTAIGLQAVDGLTPSGYLVETAKRHIEGDISIDEVRALLDSYYEAKASRTTDDADTEEADKVSANITKLLNERTFSFSPAGLAAITGASLTGSSSLPEDSANAIFPSGNGFCKANRSFMWVFPRSDRPWNMISAPEGNSVTKTCPRTR